MFLLQMNKHRIALSHDWRNLHAGQGQQAETSTTHDSVQGIRETRVISRSEAGILEGERDQLY